MVSDRLYTVVWVDKRTRAESVAYVNTSIVRAVTIVQGLRKGKPYSHERMKQDLQGWHEIREQVPQ